MSIRNPKREELLRLESKTLDARFKTAVQEGLNCSPFEAEAVLGVVREVYAPFREPARGTVPPGRIAFLLRRSRKLVEEYIHLLRECDGDKNMAYPLEELMKLGHVSAEKNYGGKVSWTASSRNFGIYKHL